MQQGIPFARSKASAQLRPGIDASPKGLAMLAFRGIHATAVVHLPCFHLGCQADNVTEVQDVSRESWHNVDSILSKSLFTKKVHKTRISAQQERRIEQ